MATLHHLSPTAPPPGPRLRSGGYLVAIVAVVAATLLRLVMDFTLGVHLPFAAFLLAVIVACWYGGRGPGITATALGAGVGAMLSNPRLLPMIDSPSERVLGLLFVVLGIVVSLAVGKLQSMNERLHQSRAELAQANEQLQESKAELERANARLQRSNEELEAFAHSIAHDLSTPMRTVGLFSKLLERNSQSLDSRAAEFHAQIQQGVERMDAMVHGLLNFARLSHSEEPRPMLVDCTHLVRAIVDDSQVLVKDCVARVEIGQLPALYADPHRLRQIFSNLITNALKYRSSRPLTVTVAAAEEADRWVFSVTDNGTGFDPADATRIFLPFTRLSASESGTGLGLSIVKRAVDCLGGSVWATSVPDVGSVFLFSLPKSQAGQAEDFGEQAAEKSRTVGA